MLDVPVPTKLLDQCPIKEGNEFTHMRYTAVTCDPDQFVVSSLQATSESAAQSSRRTTTHCDNGCTIPLVKQSCSS